MTQKDVARAMDWSPSKLIRIEAGGVGIATNDLRVLLSHYAITDHARVDNLIEIAKASRSPGRWSEYKELVSQEYLAYLGYESAASIIRNFEPVLVPGLLQTDEYAREVIGVIEGGGNPRRLDRLVDLRMERQAELLAAGGASPKLHFILDEAVIRRVVGGPEVMRRQLKHLKEMADRPNTSIRIVPFTAGMYRRGRVAYVLFEFPEADEETVLFIETALGDSTIRENSPEQAKEGTPTVYLEIFWELEQISRREDARPLLDDALARLPAPPGPPSPPAAPEPAVNNSGQIVPNSESVG